MSKSNLSLNERIIIFRGLERSLPISTIAESIGRHKTTVYRELKRNTYYQKWYIPNFAHHKALTRRTSKRRKYVTENETIIRFLKRNLKWYSPDSLAGRLRLEKHPIQVSHESIYKIIYKDFYYNGTLWKDLPRQRKRRKKQRKIVDCRGVIRNRIPISQRPDAINNRKRIGHFELDTVIGKNHKGAILTATERKTNYSYAIKIKNKESITVSKEIIKLKKNLGKLFKTGTVDNGLEFADHEYITNISGLKVFFADPRSPWQRGTNENWNGLLRRYVKKGSDFRKITQKQIDRYVNRINNMPRKKYGYRSAYEMFFKLKVAMEF
jgi:IS30 family transposase